MERILSLVAVSLLHSLLSSRNSMFPIPKIVRKRSVLTNNLQNWLKSVSTSWLWRMLSKDLVRAVLFKTTSVATSSVISPKWLRRRPIDFFRSLSHQAFFPISHLRSLLKSRLLETRKELTQRIRSVRWTMPIQRASITKLRLTWPWYSLSRWTISSSMASRRLMQPLNNLPLWKTRCILRNLSPSSKASSH